MTTPAPDLTGEQQVETVARALWEASHDRTAWEDATEDGPDEYRRLAAAAIAALPPSPAEEAAKDGWLYNEASGALYGPTDSPHLRRIVATEVEPQFGHLIANTMNRAALASPAPAPQGEEGQR